LSDNYSDAGGLQQVLIGQHDTRDMPVRQGLLEAMLKPKRWGDQKAVLPPKSTPLRCSGQSIRFYLDRWQSSDVGQADALLQLTPAGGSAAWRQGLRQRCVHSCHPGEGHASSYSASLQTELRRVTVTVCI